MAKSQRERRRPKARTTSESSPDSSQTSSVSIATLRERIRKPSGVIKRLSVCIYGLGGVGKTTLLSTLPGRGLVIDIPQIEGGTSVLEGAENIKVLPILRWTEFDAAYKMLAKDHDQWDWVALDTATATQELAKRQLMKDRKGD